VSAGCVPAWDLDVTDPKAPLDSSAAAILVDGLLQLADVDPDAQRAAGYRAYALTTLATLADAPFVSDRGRGVLLRQTYNVPADRREGTYAWGDAYLLSALARAASASSRG
jgi:unsaturated chondroitin disaccharide hydrolase